jgi:hypothetical protein
MCKAISIVCSTLSHLLGGRRTRILAPDNQRARLQPMPPACRQAGSFPSSPHYVACSRLRWPPLGGPGATSSLSTSSAIGGTPAQRGWRQPGLERAYATATVERHEMDRIRIGRPVSHANEGA